MLSLGLGAWQIIDSQVFTEPKLVSVIYNTHHHAAWPGRLAIVLCHVQHCSSVTVTDV